MSQFSRWATSNVPQDHFSFLVSLSSSIKRRMIERPSLPSPSTCDKDSAKRWITILRENPRMAFGKRASQRNCWCEGGCFRKSVEPRREKVVKNDDGLNSCARSIDRSIRHAVDTKSSHVSIYTYAPSSHDAVGKQPPSVTMRPLTPTKTLRVRPQTGLQADN